MYRILKITTILMLSHRVLRSTTLKYPFYPLAFILLRSLTIRSPNRFKWVIYRLDNSIISHFNKASLRLYRFHHID
jgi:hypothetical protein